MLTILWFCGDDWLAAVTRLYWLGHIPLSFAIFFDLMATGLLGAITNATLIGITKGLSGK